MKLPGITGFRGFAMLLIVVYHLNQIRPIQNLALLDWKMYQFVSLFPVFVSVFFLLSGLLRSISYWKVLFEGGEIPPFWKGMKDRFFRIAPLYYLALILSFLWSLYLGVEDWRSFLVGFTFFSWVHPTTFFPVPLNGPLWFVIYDMMGNIIVMVFMMTLIRAVSYFQWSKIVIGISSFFLGFFLLLLLHFLFIEIPFPKIDGILSVWFPFYNPFIFGIYYLFGALLGGIFLSLQKRGLQKNIIFDILFFVTIGTVIYLLWKMRGAGDLDYSYPTSPFRFPLMLSLFGATVFFLLFSKLISRWFDNIFFLFIAKISYPLYLIHALIITMLHTIVFSDNIESFEQWWIFSGAIFVISVIISIALMKLEAYIQKNYTMK